MTEDPDGYVNVRSAASAQSAKVHCANNGVALDVVLLQKQEAVGSEGGTLKCHSLSSHHVFAQPFKWRHFQVDIILLNVRWYMRYSLSYRDLEKMIRERGMEVDHTTIYRWVQIYSPELDKQCRPSLKTTNDSWRVYET